MLKVPHGCDGTATLKVRAQIPDGVIAVKPMPKAGWQIETVRAPYGRSYPYFHGQQLSEGVKEIVWSGGKLPDDHYDEFVFAGYLARELEPGPLYFPVTQECEKGEWRWVDVPAKGQDPHALKAPAPALVILAQQAGGSGHGHGGSTDAWPESPANGWRVERQKRCRPASDLDRVAGDGSMNTSVDWPWPGPHTE